MTKKTSKFSKILIANRGEIACRLIRASRDLSLRSVLIFSEADQGTIPVRLADERHLLTGSQAKETYLNHDKVILAAIENGADAIHPGYGFLSENHEFAKKVEDNGLTFIGPRSQTIFDMGDKLRARSIAIKAKVPVLEGMEYTGDLNEIKKFVAKISYPVIIKASAGGSGRGIRICENVDELQQKLEEASKEAISAFGSGVVYVEKYLEKPRHIELQIISDNFGNHFHLFERECSLQRRRQKLVEEAPALNLHPTLVKKIRKVALNLVKSVDYNSVGTLEFLVDGGLDKDDSFYFLEMNTRLQVEHTVSEEISNIDIAKLQIQIANHLKLKSEMFEIEPSGHSIQFRIYAEDPRNDFLPSMGEVSYCHFPSGPGVRVDTWIEKGIVVSPYYDALLAKLIISGSSREEVITRAKRALYETKIVGVKTNVEFFMWLIEQKDFIRGDVHINWIQDYWQPESLLEESKFVPPF